MATKPNNLTLGYGKCPNCGKDNVPVKVSEKNGHTYQYCLTRADGGCGGGWRNQDAEGDAHTVRRIDKWNRTEDRNQWLGDDAKPAKTKLAPKIKSDPEPQPEPTPAPPPPPKKPWYEMEL